MNTAIFISDLSMLLSGWLIVIYRVFKMDWSRASARWGWICLLGFALSATLQQNWIHLMLGDITNNPSIAWYGRYVCWIVTCYAALRMQWLLFDVNDMLRRQWNILTVIILCVESVLYFVYITESDGNPVQLVIDSGYEVVFMLTIYSYSVGVLLFSLSPLLKSFNAIQKVDHKVRMILLILSLIVAILFFILRTLTAIMGYTNIMVWIIPTITSVALISFLVACVLFLLFFSPSIVYQKIGTFISRIKIRYMGLKLFPLYRAICKLNRPVMGSQRPNLYIWMISPYLYAHIILTHVLDSKNIISRRLSENSLESRWSDMEWKFAEELSMMWVEIDDERSFEQLLPDYVAVSMRGWK